jgi:hypothetical protein
MLANPLRGEVGGVGPCEMASIRVKFQKLEKTKFEKAI